MHREHVPVAEYERLAEGFTAERWDPDAQAALARRAGMRYGVLVTRHHDGFCLWDTATTGFNALRAPAGRDLVGEWVDAFRAAGLRVGLYYSLLDWRYDAYWRGPGRDADGWAAFRAVVHEQVRELLTAYGSVDVLWYDGFWPYSGADWDASGLERMARQLQPDILINDRSGVPGDFQTPEQAVSVIPPLGRWEACLTTNDQWGWHATDRNWKTPEQVVRALVQCAWGGGNLLLNLGPRGDGSLPDPAVELLERVGEWLAVNGESVYGAVRSPFLPHAHGLFTAKPRKLYVHGFAWPAEGEVRFGWVANRVTAARLLDGGDAVRFEQRDDVVTLRGLPSAPPDPLGTVVALDLDGDPEARPGGYAWWNGEARY